MPAPAPCPHCQADVPPDAGTAPFCCRGCEGAWSLLTERGLERFYELGTGLPTQPPAAAARDAWLAPMVSRARAEGGDTLPLRLAVGGIHCAGCVWVIQALFARRDGGVHLDLNPGRGEITLHVQDGVFDVASFLSDLGQIGYPTGPHAVATGANNAADTAARSLAVRLGVTVALAVNVMMLSLAGYFGLDPAQNPALAAIFGWLQLGLATLAVAVGGPVFFRGAWGALRRGALHLDVPIALGIVLAWAGSVALAITQGPEAAYFDTVAIFVALMLLGRWLQARAIAAGRRLLIGETPFGDLSVRLLAQDGSVTLAAVRTLTAGQRLLLAPGELVPVAAHVSDEGAHVDLSWITGESEPVAAARGDALPAGAHVCDAPLQVVTSESYANSALHGLLAAPDPHDHEHGAVRGAGRFWHRVGTVYVVATLLLAAFAAVSWAASGAASALEVTVAVLVVTCPCAIGLAAPLAYELAHARLRQRGLFVRRHGVLDRLHCVTDVVFDKTGTLTSAEPTVADPDALAALPFPAREALAQLTAASNHPKSRALFAALNATGTSARLSAGTRATEVAGRGVRLDSGWELHGDPGCDDALTLWRPDGSPAAAFSFEERAHHDAAGQTDALAGLGLTVWLASGDAAARVQAVGAELQLDPSRTFAAQSPDDKAALVRRLQERGHVLMIGDGVNDAPAARAATVSGALATGRPALPSRVDFFLLGAGLGPIAEGVALARRVRRVAAGNLVFALVYNAAGVSLALAGLLSPLLCAVAMPLSALTVISATTAALRRPLPTLSTSQRPRTGLDGRALPDPLRQPRAGAVGGPLISAQQPTA